MKFVAGLFVGGRASRMGGIAKGLLRAPDGEPIAVRTRRLLEGAGGRCVLVGENAAYDELGLEVVPDDRSTSGPLAGILALLRFTEAASSSVALAVACDMPRLSAELVQRLVDAPPALVVAPRRGDLWEPLCARYEVGLLPVARRFAEGGGRRLQALLDEAQAHPLPLGAADLGALDDWDSPGDLPETARRGTGLP